MERTTVMIVAVSPFHLALMADLLEANDIRTVRATSAEDAFETVQTTRLTLAVLDLDLPEEASRKIMSFLANPKVGVGIPVIAVGDRGQQEIFASVLAACESSSLEKPIDTGMFPRRVIQEIRRHTTGVSREALL